MEQLDYIKYIAEKNYNTFYEQGYASPGHNGPHGHIDTPVRNTSHFLIIYCFLYKRFSIKKYKNICDKFAKYLINEQRKSKSGAIQCMLSDRFDHINGLIGQAWVIEGLLYYYKVFHKKEALDTSIRIFEAQKYDYSIHLWHRIELNGEDIGIDLTYNHNTWFAACSLEILDYCDNENIKSILNDFLTNGVKRDFKVYKNGLLHHVVNIKSTKFLNKSIKNCIKDSLFFLRKIDLKKFDSKYMAKAYHVFDMYSFCIIKEKIPSLELFKTSSFFKAKKLALNIYKLNRWYNIPFCLKNKSSNFNVFSYSYNTLTFEYPYVALCFKKENISTFNFLYSIQKRLMYSPDTNNFTNNNPDINTFEARSYEIIRYFDKKGC